MTEEIEITHLNYHAKISLYVTAKGYWLEGIGLTMPISGSSYAPSVWRDTAFTDKDSARHYALAYLVERVSKCSDHPSSNSARSVFLQKLEYAKTPQLCLF